MSSPETRISLENKKKVPPIEVRVLLSQPATGKEVETQEGEKFLTYTCFVYKREGDKLVARFIGGQVDAKNPSVESNGYNVVRGLVARDTHVFPVPDSLQQIHFSNNQNLFFGHLLAGDRGYSVDDKEGIDGYLNLNVSQLRQFLRGASFKYKVVDSDGGSAELEVDLCAEDKKYISSLNRETVDRIIQFAQKREDERNQPVESANTTEEQTALDLRRRVDLENLKDLLLNTCKVDMESGRGIPGAALQIMNFLFGRENDGCKIGAEEIWKIWGNPVGKGLLLFLSTMNQVAEQSLSPEDYPDPISRGLKKLKSGKLRIKKLRIKKPDCKKLPEEKIFLPDLENSEKMIVLGLVIDEFFKYFLEKSGLDEDVLGQYPFIVNPTRDDFHGKSTATKEYLTRLIRLASGNFEDRDFAALENQFNIIIDKKRASFQAKIKLILMAIFVEMYDAQSHLIEIGNTKGIFDYFREDTRIFFKERIKSPVSLLRAALNANVGFGAKSAVLEDGKVSFDPKIFGDTFGGALIFEEAIDEITGMIDSNSQNDFFNKVSFKDAIPVGERKLPKYLIDYLEGYEKKMKKNGVEVIFSEFVPFPKDGSGFVSGSAGSGGANLRFAKCKVEYKYTTEKGKRISIPAELQFFGREKITIDDHNRVIKGGKYFYDQKVADDARYADDRQRNLGGSSAMIQTLLENLFPYSVYGKISKKKKN